MSEHPGVAHHWIEDGKGKPLGRSFAVKLLRQRSIFLHDGHELARVVRPNAATDLASALQILLEASAPCASQ